MRPISLGTVVAVAVIAVQAGAQTLSGEVRGAGQPVVGAKVLVVELDRAERTGADGAFRFANVPHGTYRVFVSVVGYSSATDTVQVTGDHATATFDLVPSAVPLKEVVVSASPVPRPSDEQYLPTESKSRRDLDNSAGSSFAEKISDLPGVTVRWNGSAPSRPIVRGLGDNEVLMLENGLRTGDIATFDPAHATPIDALSIETIDVVRGPAAIVYGPNTIGGLVNVITNLVPVASDRPWSGTVALEANTVSGEVSGYADNVLTSGGSAFRVAAGGVHAGGIRIPSGTYTDPGTGAMFALDRIPQSFNRSGEGGLGYSYQGDFGMIGLGVNHYEMNYGIPGVPPNPDWLTVPPTTSRIEQNRTTLEMRGVFNTGGSWFPRVSLSAGYNDYTHSEFPTAEDSSGVSDPQANHFHKREFNGLLQFRQHPLGRLTGTLGIWTNIEDLTIEGDQPLGPNSATTGLAAFAYEEWALSPATRLQAAARFDYHKIQTRPFAQSTDSVFRTIDESRLSNAATASIGAVRQFGAHVTATMSLARSFRAPTVQELFANGLDAASGTYSIGSANLGPEHGLGADASVIGSFGNVTFTASPYLNYIDHYIFGFLRGDTIQGFPVRQFGATRARLAGFEASVDVLPIPTLVLRASSDYVNAEDTRLNQPLPFIPPLRGLLRATFQNQKYMGTVEWRAAARQGRLGVGDTPTAGYAVMNLGAGIRLVHQGVVSDISVHCDNVFNVVYRDNLSVVKDFVPQPGRGFRLNYQLLY